MTVDWPSGGHLFTVLGYVSMPSRIKKEAKMDTEVLGYTVICEYVSDNNWSPSVPDLPGLAVGGSTKEEVERKIQEGIVFHIKGLKEDGLPVPAPTPQP
jgi:predicted RNase H-like HicB family nuclease